MPGPAKTLKFAIMATMLFGAPAGRAEIAEQTPAKIEVVTEELPPFNFTMNGKITGSSTDVVLAVLKEAGIEGHVRSIPWARALSMARSRPNVLIYTISPTADRLPHFKWIGPINSGNVVLFCLKSNPISIKSLDEAKRHKLGTIFNDFRLEFLLRSGFIEGDNVDSTNSHDLNYSKLKAGRIDLWPMDSSVMRYIVKRAGDDPDKMVMPVLEMTELEAQSGWFMAFGLETPDQLVERLRLSLARIKENGTFEAIMRKWK